MSWGYNTMRKCEKCGHESMVEESTLNINSKSYGVCPRCGGEMIVEETDSIDDAIARSIELIRKRKEAKMKKLI